MPFRNDKQRSHACKVLLSLVELEHLWDEERGPTEGAVAQLHRAEDGECLLSNGEQVMLRTAFDIWNGGGGATLWDMMTGLEPDMSVAIGDLVLRASQDDPDLVDEWIRENSFPEEPNLALVD